MELCRQFLDKLHVDARALAVREWEVQYCTTLMQLSGKKAVHCEEAMLKIDNRQEIEQ